MDEGKNDDGPDGIIVDNDNYSMYNDRQGFRVNDFSNGKNVARNDGFYYSSSSPTHVSGNGNRTLPQPPRSLPMTPGSNTAAQRISFIPSKPFNNFMNQPQEVTTTLSTSAPAPISSRPPIAVTSSSSLSSTSTASSSSAPPGTNTIKTFSLCNWLRWCKSRGRPKVSLTLAKRTEIVLLQI